MLTTVYRIFAVSRTGICSCGTMVAPLGTNLGRRASHKPHLSHQSPSPRWLAARTMMRWTRNLRRILERLPSHIRKNQNLTSPLLGSRGPQDLSSSLHSTRALPRITEMLGPLINRSNSNRLHSATPKPSSGRPVNNTSCLTCPHIQSPTQQQTPPTQQDASPQPPALNCLCGPVSLPAQQRRHVLVPPFPTLFSLPLAVSTPVPSSELLLVLNILKVTLYGTNQDSVHARDRSCRRYPPSRLSSLQGVALLLIAGFLFQVRTC